MMMSVRFTTLTQRLLTSTAVALLLGVGACASDAVDAPAAPRTRTSAGATT